MAETLVIHPKDRTTNFLTPIYENIHGGYIRKSNYGEIREALTRENIKQYKRIMFLGHGTAQGLLNPLGYDYSTSMMLNNFDVYEFLSLNIDIVAIWCNADKFWKQFPILPNNILYSGQKFVSQSNNFFARELGELFTNKDMPLSVIHSKIKQSYEQFAKSFYSSIAKYNAERLYFNAK